MPDNKDKTIKLDKPLYFDIPRQKHETSESSAGQTISNSPIYQSFGNTDFGDSKYDNIGKTQIEDIQSGDYQYIRGEQQSGLGQIGLGTLRAISKAGVEFAKTPAYLYSLGEWGVRNAKGEDFTLDKALDNAWLNYFENVDENIKKELLPVYQSYKAGNGSFLDQIFTTSFIAREGADGVGYLTGMMGGSLALKSLNLASKLSKLGLGAELASDVELGTQTLLNTSVEALAEAKGVGDRLKVEGATPEQIAERSKETFYANMALLILPNAIMNKNLLGRYNVDKSMLDEFKDASGKLLDNPIVKKTMLKDYGKSIAGAAISEGLVEEGGQTSIENYEVNKGLGKTSSEFIEGVAQEYLNTISTTDGLKSIVLGSVLGSLGGAKGTYSERKANQEYRNKNFSTISQLIKDNFEGFGGDNEIYDRDENGVQTEVNPIKLREAVEDFVKEVTESQFKDLASLNEDKILHDYLNNKTFTRAAIPFLKLGDVGLELLNDKIDKASEVLSKNNQNDSFNENTFKAEQKAKAKQLLEVYDTTMNVVSNFKSVRMLQGLEGSEEYTDKMFNAAFQEVSKQIFYKEKIQDLNNELGKFNSVIFNDLPQNQIKVKELQNQINGLNKLLEESKVKYLALDNEQEQAKALNEFITNKNKQAEELEKLKKEQETKEKSKVINEEFEAKIKTALDTKSLDEFDTIDSEFKDNAYITNDIKKQLVKKRNTLNKAIDEFTKALRDGRNEQLNTPEAQEFYQNNKTHIEAKLAEYQAKATPPPTLSEVVGETIDLYEDEVSTEDQEQVSEANKLGSVKSDDEAKVYEKIDYNEAVVKNKSIKYKTNVIMMHLFNHFFNAVNQFRFQRNEEGLPELDNTSNININALNKLNIGDRVQLKLVDVTPEVNDQYKTLEDFDGKHIAIYSNNELVGFVKQPHPVSTESNDVELSKKVRQDLIKYRKLVISKLENNEDVFEEITEKGTGNLYSKLDKDGFVNATYNPFENVRPQDKIEDQLVFVYADKAGKLILPPIDIDEDAKKQLELRLAELNKFDSKPGKIFQLVKDLNNNWYPMPIYANSMNKVTVDAIMNYLDTVTPETEPKDIVRNLQPYIYASQSKTNATLIVNNNDGVIKFSVDGIAITLDELQVPYRRNNFINSLMSKRQNISINDINNTSFQQQLIDRDTLVTNVTTFELVTNVTTFEGEYFVQPYFEISFNNLLVKAKAEILTQEANDLSSTQPTTNSSSSLNTKAAEILKGLNLNTPLNDDNALSQVKDSTPLDKKQFKSWLAKRLPQLSLSDVESIYQLKDVLTDAIGMFRDSTIYLFEGSGQKTAYHEAFHGVFRNLLTVKEREDIIREALNKYEAPTEKHLQDLQDGLKNTYSKEQLTYLYYEEKLSDDFADYAYDRNDANFWTKLGTKIKDFFNKIFNFYKIFKSTNPTTIDEIFANTNNGKLATIESKSNSVVNRSLFNEYAYSKQLSNNLGGVSNKARYTRVIGDRFMSIFQKNILENNKQEPIEIFNDILKDYKKALISANTQEKQIKVGRIIVNYPDLINEVKKYLAYRNIIIKQKIEYNENLEELITNSNPADITLDFVTNLTQEATTDEEIVTLESKTVKGLGEWTSISGLTSASTRVKLFLSSIPVLKDGKEVTDEFGIPLYHDFTDLYYYIERNLIQKYELEEQIKELQKLAINRPELNQVIDMISTKPTNMNQEQFDLLQNDFKTNFSKQQLAYTLVKFDTDSSTGKVTYEIIDANRESLGREIFNQWTDNLYNGIRDTVGEVTETNEQKINSTKAKKLLEEWNKLNDSKKLLDYSKVNPILLQMGIEYTPEVLRKLLTENDLIFKNNITSVLTWYADENPDNLAAKGRESLSQLVALEVSNMMEKYTSSFINGENKNIYTIQLPSFISKTLAKIKTSSKYKTWKQDMLKDDFYYKSNILEMLDNINYRDIFKISYLDSFKDSRGKKEGSTFTSLQPKDFLATQLSLFLNSSVNNQLTTKIEQNKYVYLTPSDKTMCVIVDSTSFNVELLEGKREIDPEKSIILEKYLNIFISEAIRIKKTNDIKNDIINNRNKGKYRLKDLLEHYHVSKNNFDEISKLVDKEELTDEDITTINKLIDGKAFKFNYFSESFNNDMLAQLGDMIYNSNGKADINNKVLNDKDIRQIVVKALTNELNKDFKNTLVEFQEKGIIKYDPKTKLYSSDIIDLKDDKVNEASSRMLLKTIAKFSTNTLLHNIELNNIFNGDFAQYKPGDLQKRTYQSQAMTVLGNFKDKVIKTMVVKDVKSSTDPNVYNTIDQIIRPFAGDKTADYIKSKYEKDINVTDAQVYITPDFYKRIHVARGTWTTEKQEAYDIIEGIKEDTDKIEYNNISEQLKNKKLSEDKIKELKDKQKELSTKIFNRIRQLEGIKPYYFGNRFDSSLGIQRFEQVKCAMIPLFKEYLDINPLLKDKLEQMKAQNVDMLAHESSFKAAIGNRTEITDDNHLILDLNTDNFGIQVDNPDHMTEGNDSLRQLKMLILGSVDKSVTYNGVNGKDIIDSITSMEAFNLQESLDELKDKMNIKNNVQFAHFIKDMVTKRGATINIEEILNIVDGNFEYALDNGTVATQVENMISSVFTNNAIKQSFDIGGSAVQATSLGLKFRNLAEQQEGLTPELLKIQQELKWIKPNLETGKLEYAECCMPAWTEKFFKADGTLKDINNIPDEVKELIAYRIPTEGLHSMLPIKVVKFLPPTMGNFILLPYEITTQFGADFDFDKVYFVGRDFYKNEEGQFEAYKYINGEGKDAISKRYYQYTQTVSASNRMSYDTFIQLPVSRQNVRAARNNEILNNYFTLLSSFNNLHLLISPSGFDVLEDFKKKYFPDYYKNNFFSSITQRDFKERNHIGIALKGQAALHVSGHSYGVLMNLETTSYDKEGKLEYNKAVNIDGNRTVFNELYTDNGKLIADELASIMAAILDDIKNPLLEPLGINNNTIDVLATIIRSGVNMETALAFTSQPSVKALSNLLSANKNKIKELNQPRYDVNFMINAYTNLTKEALEEVKKTDANPIYEDYVNILDDLKDTLNTNDLINFIQMYKFDKNELFKGETYTDENGKDRIKFKKASPLETLKYYSYQTRVLKQFANIEGIAKELVKTNKFFAINKEVGPNIEDIISKRDILNEIQSSTLLKGFDLKAIPTLEITWDIHKEALAWFEQYFPYSTDKYMDIKSKVSKMQFNKPINQLKVEERQFMNNFIRTFTDYKFFNISDKETYDNLLFKIPDLLVRIKSAENANNTYSYEKGEETIITPINYNALKNNTFIQQLKVSFDKKNKGVKYIQLKGNRLDLQVKNNVIEGFTTLYNNQYTQKLAIDLLKHSFLTTGFFKGIRSYSSLISPEIMKSLGYNDFRKELISLFKDNLVSLSPNEEYNLIDQMVRNNPRTFTKTFDQEIFKVSTDKALPNTISTNIKLVEDSGRASELMFISYDQLGNQIIDNPYLITVYDKFSKKPELYALIDQFTWEKTTQLGKNGNLIEINTEDYIKKSYLKDNNPSEESMEEEAQPVMEANSLPTNPFELTNSIEINNLTNESNPENELPPLKNPCE